MFISLAIIGRSLTGCFSAPAWGSGEGGAAASQDSSTGDVAMGSVPGKLDVYGSMDVKSQPSKA